MFKFCSPYLIYDIKVILQGLCGYLPKVLLKDVDKRLQKREYVERIHYSLSERDPANKDCYGRTVTTHWTQYPEVPMFDMAACTWSIQLQARNIEHRINVTWTLGLRDGGVQCFDVQ